MHDIHNVSTPIILDSIFCVDVEKYSPDIVLIDFSVNDYGPPKLMDSLIRRVMR